MARAIWSGAISFGLVNVPIRLYTAISQKEIRFNMLHGKDGGRIHLKRTCSVDGEEVPYDEIVKGYEVTRGNFVEVDPKELEKFDPKATHSVDIEDFVDLNQIDPIFYEHSYHVVPDKGAGRAYALLLKAMQTTNKVAIARMVMRTKGYLCALRPVGKSLMLSTMLYADEVIPASDLDFPEAEHAPRGKELEMAEKLIESLSEEFTPEKYKDEYRARVVELIEKKAEGQELVEPEEGVAESGKVVNLADALAASLAAGRKRNGAGARHGDEEKKPARKAPARSHSRAAPREHAAASTKRASHARKKK